MSKKIDIGSKNYFSKNFGEFCKIIENLVEQNLLNENKRVTIRITGALKRKYYIKTKRTAKYYLKKYQKAQSSKDINEK